MSRATIRQAPIFTTCETGKRFPSAARERFLNLVRGHRDVHAGTLLLQQHEDARIALGPTTVERFGQLPMNERGDAQRDILLAT